MTSVRIHYENWQLQQIVSFNIATSLPKIPRTNHFKYQTNILCWAKLSKPGVEHLLRFLGYRLKVAISYIYFIINVKTKKHNHF